MPQIQRTSLAQLDAQEIWLHIARHNVSAADRMIDRIDAVLEQLASTPGMGEHLDRVRPGMKCFTVQKYVVFFESIPNGVRVLRILHGARKWEDLV